MTENGEFPRGANALDERLAIATELLRLVEGAGYFPGGWRAWQPGTLPKRVERFLDEEYADMGVPNRKAIYGERKSA